MAKAKVFDNLEEIKSFLIWAKEQGVRRAKVGDLEVEFSDMAMVVQYQDKLSPTAGLGAILQPKSEEQLKKEEEDLLFHSSLP